MVNDFPITRGFEYRTNDGGNIDYTNAVNSNFVFDIRVSLNRFVQERRPAKLFDPSTLGFTRLHSPPCAAINTCHRMIRNLDAPRPIDRRSAQRDQIGTKAASARSTWAGAAIGAGRRQSHVKYGYDFRVVRENFSTDAYKGGQFFFDGTFTAPASNSRRARCETFLDATSLRFCSAFRRRVLEETRARSIIRSTTRSSLYHGIFFQDDWRVSRKLTLNLGLRYDLEQGLTERFNRILRGFDFGTPSPIEPQVRAAYTTAFNANPANFVVTPANFHVLGGYTFADENNRNVWEADRSNFQPRIGASYQLTEKTVVRAGFGIFMAPFQIETPQQVGFAGTTPFVPSNNNGLTFVATLTNPFPNGLSAVQPSFGSSLGLLTGIGADVAADTAPIFGLLRKNSKFARFVLAFNASCRAISSLKQTSSAPPVTICRSAAT